MQEEEAVREANLALRACASRAFCFWKLAGAASESAAKTRTARDANLVEKIMMTTTRGVFVQRRRGLVPVPEDEDMKERLALGE